jgi:hypothetical protein
MNAICHGLELNYLEHVGIRVKYNIHILKAILTLSLLSVLLKIS